MISNNYVPEKINDANCYLDGEKMIGVAASVTLPEINMKTSTIAGMGINGEIDSPTIGQFESMEQEIQFLKEKAESENEIEILAEAGGSVVGSAGIWCIRNKEKIRHRAGFGISVDKAYWSLGIGRALTEACIECAGAAGYKQLELDVLADNEKAVALYKSLGFVDYGRNPRGINLRSSGYHELVLMRLELD